MPVAAPVKVDHAAIALKYARDVVAGTVPAGQWVVKAAKRHLRDLERERSPDFPYTFEPECGARVARFCELMPHTKGKWAARGELLKLSPWQSFLVVVGFGWILKGSKDPQSQPHGLRRFRTFYWEIPRKNGKSALAAALGLYMLSADHEHGAEIYSGATTEKQAWEVFRPARLMALKTPQLARRYAVDVWAKSIVIENKSARFEPIIGNPGDGASPSLAIIDEFHEHQTSSLYDTMETGMGAREQPLMLVITTAGTNIAGPCYDKHEQVTKVLDEVFQDESLFGVIFSADPEDDWADPKTLIKANPNFGVSVNADFLQQQQRAAMASPAKQTAFKTKHLNVWCSVLNGWLNMALWSAARIPLKGEVLEVEEDDLVGAECIFAIDLASKSDLCTEQRLYRRMESDVWHYYLFGKYWLPEQAVNAEGPNQSIYQKWVASGLLTMTWGASVDFAQVGDELLEDCKRSNPQEVVFDPFNATQMAQGLQEHEITCVEFAQTPQNFAVPMDDLETALKDGRFHHDGNEITTWCFSNVVGRPAKKGLVAPAKQKPHQKIDGAVATIMCMARAAAEPEQAKEYQLLFV